MTTAKAARLMSMRGADNGVADCVLATSDSRAKSLDVRS